MSDTANKSKTEIAQRPAWTKGGISPNPSGRPKVDKEIAALARTYGPELIDRCIVIVRDEDQKMQHRLIALQILLERGYGKAPQSIELTGEDGGPLAITSHDLRTMPLEELERRVELAAKLATAVDAEFKEVDDA